jgi:hypothetical protein
MKKVKEKGIIFDADMVRETLSGRKTSIRRVIESQPPEGSSPIYDSLDCYWGEGWAFQYPKKVFEDLVFNSIFELPQNGRCPYGKVGDRLWVRENWGYHGSASGGDPEVHSSSVKYLADGERREIYFDSFEEMSNASPGQNIKYPKWITEMDEFEQQYHTSEFLYDWWEKQKSKPSTHMRRWASRITLKITHVGISRLQNITAEEAVREGILNWEENPWVWVVKFKKI